MTNTTTTEATAQAAAAQEAGRAHNAPAYVLTIGGRDISPRISGLLMRLTLKESRGDQADELEIELDDSSGRINLPPAGEKLALRLGWQGQPLLDKGEFVVDEVEHRGAPDVLTIRARSADLRSSLRERREASYHGATLGQIVERIASRHGLRARVAPALAGVKVAHIDQSHESDLNFLTRLGRRWDATATVKKGLLIVQPINARTTATGARLGDVRIERRDGDQHRWHRAERGVYSGVRAEWQDNKGARKRSALAGKRGKTKKLREIYGSEAAAMDAARAEMQRIERGGATLELTLAYARPDIAPQSAATVTGWGKKEIDDARWLVKSCTHSLDASQGFTTRLELESQGADSAAAPADEAGGDEGVDAGGDAGD